MIYVVTNNEGKIRPISKPFTTDKSFIPIGSITPGFTEEDGWIFCEGQQLSVKEYPALFDIIGYTYGGEGEYFSLPDMREYVPCGAGKRASNTSEEMILGTCYESQIGSHTHAQSAHCHCRPAHTHTGNSHSHSGCSHTHIYSKPASCGAGGCCSSAVFPFTVCVCERRQCTATFCSTVCPSNSGSAGGTSSTNSTGDLNAAAATNCSTGATSGGTHGRRLGLHYLIRIV